MSDGAPEFPGPSRPDDMRPGGEPEVGGLRARTARGTILNSAFLVGLGTLNLVRAVVIAGLLTASEFGVWIIVVLTAGLIVAVKGAMVSDKYVQQRESDQEAAFQKAFTLELASAGVMAVVLVATAPLLVLAYGREELLLPTIVLALQVPALALQAPIWIFYRRMRFLQQRLLLSVDAIVSFALTIALAAAGAGYWSLVIGTVVGAWVGAGFAVAFSPLPLGIRYDRETLKEYVSFSWPLVAAATGGMLMAQFGVFFGNLGLGLAGAGAIGLSATLRAYTDRVGQIITSTMYPAICRVRERRALLFEAFIKSNRLALIWGMLYGVGLTLFAADLVEFVIGEQWRDALILLQVAGVTAALNHVGFNWTAFYRALGVTRPIAVVTWASVLTFSVTALPLVLVAGLPGFAAGIAASAVVALAIRWHYVRRLFPGISVSRHLWRATLPSLLPVGLILTLRALESGERTGATALVELGLYLSLTMLATAFLERALLREVWGYVRNRSQAGTDTLATR